MPTPRAWRCRLRWPRPSTTVRRSSRRSKTLPTTHGLLEELVGREIATRLRARHAEILARIHEQGFEHAQTAQWIERAESLDPDTWLTPDAVLDGVRDADRRFEALRTALLAAR